VQAARFHPAADLVDPRKNLEPQMNANERKYQTKIGASDDRITQPRSQLGIIIINPRRAAATWSILHPDHGHFTYLRSFAVQNSYLSHP
jgi:hypothetical protein